MYYPFSPLNPSDGIIAVLGANLFYVNVVRAHALHYSALAITRIHKDEFKTPGGVPTPSHRLQARL